MWMFRLGLCLVQAESTALARQTPFGVGPVVDDRLYQLASRREGGLRDPLEDMGESADVPYDPHESCSQNARLLRNWPAGKLSSTIWTDSKGVCRAKAVDSAEPSKLPQLNIHMAPQPRHFDTHWTLIRASTSKRHAPAITVKRRPLSHHCLKPQKHGFAWLSPTRLTSKALWRKQSQQ